MFRCALVLVLALCSTNHQYKLAPVGSISVTSNATVSSVSMNSDASVLAINSDQGLGVYIKGTISKFLNHRNFSNSYKSYYSVFSLDSTELIAVGENLSISIFRKQPIAGAEYSLVQNTNANDTSSVYIKAALTNDAMRLITASSDGNISVHLRQPNNTFSFESSFRSGSSSIKAIAVRFGGILVVSGAQIEVNVWKFNYTTNRYSLYQNLTTDSQVLCLDLLTSEQLLIGGSASGAIKTWKQKNGLFIALHDIKFHNSAISQIIFTQPTQFLVACPGEDKITLWKIDHDDYDQRKVKSQVSGQDFQLVSADLNGHSVACSNRSINCTIFSLQIDCAKQLQSNGTNLDDNSCYCVKPFEWDIVEQECKINCAAVQHSTGMYDADDLACKCVSGYSWQPISRSCQLVPAFVWALIGVGLVLFIIIIAATVNFILKPCKSNTKDSSTEEQTHFEFRSSSSNSNSSHSLSSHSKSLSQLNQQEDANVSFSSIISIQ